MANTTEIVLITLLVIFIIAIISYLVFQKMNKKWSCTEGKCELDINGEYPSKSDCIASCKEKQSQMMQGSNNKLNAWACTSEYNCVPASQGYTSKELCEQNCSAPATPEYHYYPQSMYVPVRGYDYWWPRRRFYRRRFW